jgi:tetratricopeptide (TPR) repeat protein
MQGPSAIFIVNFPQGESVGMKRMKWAAAILITGMALAAQQDPAFEWNEQGLAVARTGDQQAAEKLYEQAIARWRTLGTGYEAHLATSLSNLGMAQCAQGRRRECAATLEESLAIFRRTLGLSNDRTLTAMNLLAGVCLMMEDNVRAEALFSEALPVERQYFANDVQLSRTLGGLASLKMQRGELEPALPLAEEALKVTLAAEGEESIDTALEYANVAEIHRVAGRRERALPLFRKAREIYEKQLGAEHPRVASMLSQEGIILMDDNKLGMAGRLMERARKIVDEHCAGCDFEQAVTRSNLGLLRMKQKRYVEADVLLSEALSLQEKYSKRPGSNMAATLQALAQVRNHQKRYDEAARLNQRASTIMSFR